MPWLFWSQAATIQPMTDWLLIFGGLVTLIVGAEMLVRGSVWIALALGVSKLTVGLTIVAFGTSAPELVVSVLDVAKPDSAGPVGAIALGNVFGSNIANIGLILGLTAVVREVPTTESKLRFEAYWMILASILCMKPLVLQGRYTYLDGVVLLSLLGLFTVMLWHRERRKTNRKADDHLPVDIGIPDDSPARAAPGRVILHVFLVALGLAGLFYGGQWLVAGCKGAARNLGMPESLIGATIVAVGTSLPELATAVVAARRGHPEIAVGNIVGSNVFNICMVLGACAVIRPLPVTFPEHGLRMSIGLVLAVVLGILLMRKTRISRRAGGILLVCYLGYLTAEVVRL
jgi:cation:H+ antiporter